MAAKIAEYFQSEAKSTILEHGIYVRAKIDNLYEELYGRPFFAYRAERTHNHSTTRWVMTIGDRLKILSSMHSKVNGLSASRN
jgi:hypothetical protein